MFKLSSLQSAALAKLPVHIQAQISKPLVALRAERYITQDPRSLQMLKAANQVAFAKGRQPVLITGESGTGKEIIAQIMLENRSVKEFYPANCAGVVDTLFESILFGHVRGSFTGAVNDRPGLLVAAGEGIVFLDEVGELPLNQQAKLLRAIQERKVQPVGAEREVPIKCRFVFATNKNLADMVAKGQFRDDLFYRISALTLSTYPLRERPDDAILIAAQKCQDNYWDMPDMIPPAVTNSTGNVRALENWLLQRTVYGVGRDGINPAMGENIVA